MVLDSETIFVLNQQFPGRVIMCGDDRFADYATDATEIECMPDVVVFPESTDDVVSAVRLSRRYSFPLIARGAGTGYSGGAVATQGGMVLSVERMNRILGVDAGSHTAVVESGVITYDLDLAANRHGLFYPPDPASYKESTLAGNLAECAGGLRCVKYGVTKDYVLGVEYVDYAGDIRVAGSMADDGEAFDITSLMVGSEGTLGIVTRMHLKLLPIPEARGTFLYTFRSEVDAARAVTAIRGSGVVPCVMEFMDGNALEAVIRYLDLNGMPEAAAMLLVELDGTVEEVERDSEIVAALMPKYGPLINRQASDGAEREDLWRLRRELSTAVKEYSVVKTSEDVCVPLTRFADLVGRIGEISAERGLRTAAFGHAGDGNLHVCFVIPEMSDDIHRGMEASKADLLRATLELGGTISGEHGIGFTKKDFLSAEVGDDVMELFRLVKASFDPANLLNPGKIF